ncbi:MAG: peptidoglycan-binding domain-containing protein [Candidatus Bathyarchaeia archaeon]
MLKKLFFVSLLAVGLIFVSGYSLAQNEPAGSSYALPNTDSSHVLTPASPTDNTQSVSPETVPAVNLKPGQKAAHVRKLQAILKNLGYLPPDTAPSNFFGSETKAALKKFQKDHGLPANGFFGPATRTALKNKLKASGATAAVIDKNIDIVCMKAAVEKRENALLTAWDTYPTKIKTARETRKTELLAAWSIQDPKERHNAIKSAWEKYRQSLKAAKNEWGQNKKAAWEQFYQEAKNCKASVTGIQSIESSEQEE